MAEPSFGVGACAPVSLTTETCCLWEMPGKDDALSLVTLSDRLSSSNGNHRLVQKKDVYYCGTQIEPQLCQFLAVWASSVFFYSSPRKCDGCNITWSSPKKRELLACSSIPLPRNVMLWMWHHVITSDSLRRLRWCIPNRARCASDNNKSNKSLMILYWGMFILNTSLMTNWLCGDILKLTCVSCVWRCIPQTF